MYHIIINPASRSGQGLKLWKTVIEPALHAERVVYRSYFSDKPGDVARITSEITAFDREVTLLVLGGDGTVNESLQGVRDFSLVRFGYIPTGSSNDLARDLGIPKNPLDALHAILHSESPVPMDIGTLHLPDGSHRHFAGSCGIGFDAAVCEETFRSRLKLILNKAGLGKLTYLGIALKQLVSAGSASCRITLGDDTTVQVRRLIFAATMVHRYEGGGFMFCPDAKYDDGLLDMCVVGDLSKPRLLAALPSAFSGRHYSVDGVDGYRTSHVRIRTSLPLWVHTDGELVGQCNDLRITCREKVLSFIL